MQFEASPWCWMGTILEEMHRNGWKVHSFIHLKKKEIRKVDEERTKSKIPHPNVHVEKGVLKEVESDIIKNNRIDISKSKNRYW